MSRKLFRTFRHNDKRVKIRLWPTDVDGNAGDPGDLTKEDWDPIFARQIESAKALLNEGHQSGQINDEYLMGSWKITR